ncbi:MAG: WhiB family transcriptional regulator [Ilumatobacteraceae bacterium]
MTDHDALRAIAAAVAFPDVHGVRHGAQWPPTTKATLPPREAGDDRAWVPRANCRGMDPDLFHPERGDNGTNIANAKAVCQGCEVRSECLEFAIAHREKIGIWGGTTPKERRAIISERGLPETLPQPIEHGTWQGYVAEIRRGIPTCSLCRHAHAAYRSSRRAHKETP